MPLFRLVWVTSCISLLLACTQSFLRLPNFVSSALGYSWEGAIASASASSLNAEFAPSNSREFQVTSAVIQKPHSFEPAFCRFSPEPQKILQPPVSTASLQASQQEMNGKTISQRLGSLMKNVLGRPEKPESQAQISPASLVAITPLQSSHSNLRIGLLSQDMSRLRQALKSGKQPPLEPEPGFQVSVNGHSIAKLAQQHQADLVAQRLRNVVSQTDFQAEQVKPGLLGGKPAVMLGSRLLFVVNEAIAPTQKKELNRDLLAIQWANRLRVAMGASPLNLIHAQRKMYSLEETATTFEGLASWYGDYFHGRPTANGETFNQHDFTAAHPSLPFDTYLKVTNLKNNDSVIVRINDRGPFVPPRTLDLSKGVARCLNSEQTGVFPYSAILMKQDSPLDNI